MATEAQKLIGLSLTKIAQSRMNRGGISLHKNLLVATVLQKARFIFMEEAYAATYTSEVIPQPSPPPPPVPRSADSELRLQPPVERDEQERGKRVHKRRRESENDSEEASVDASAPKRCCGDNRPQTRAASTADTSRKLYQSGFSERSAADHCDMDYSEEPMEVDRITSLVSVFSFGANAAVEPLARLARSVSTPDFCSAQAKELDSIQRRTALAMTV